MTISAQILFNGVMSGVLVGLLAVGIVLVFRSSRVINFAYGEIGVFGAVLLAMLVTNYGINFWLALVLAMLAGAAISLAMELIVVRRLFEAPRVILFVATLGATLLVRVGIVALPDIESSQAGAFPTPFFVQPSRDNPDAAYSLFGLDIPISIGSIDVLGRDMMVLLFAPIALALVTWFVTRTLYGLCVRAASVNADAARLAGVSPRLMSSIVWTMAGALSVLTVTLLMPVKGLSPGPVVEAAGPDILLRALAAALAARMLSLPIAMGAGIALGVVEALVIANQSVDRLLLDSPGSYFVILLAVILALVVVQSRRGNTEDEGAFSFSPRTRPIPDHLRQLWWIKHLDKLAAGAALGLALLAPVVLDLSSMNQLSSAYLVGLIALSIVVLTGWAGQLSLGQFAIAGLGALSTATFTNRGIPWGGGWIAPEGLPVFLSMVLATAFCIMVAMVVGAPALRVKGLFLAATTLGFAIMCDQWLYQQEIFLPSGQQSAQVPRGAIGPVSFESSTRYHYLCLATLVVAVIMVNRLRASGIGRTMIAVRDNQSSAAAYTVSPTRAKITAFGIAGGLAGLAGAMTGALFQNVNPADYSVTASLDVVALTIIGGVGTATGGVVGALWVAGLPAFVGFNSQVNLFRNGIGLLLIILYFPGGLIQIGHSVRDLLVTRAAERLPAPINKSSSTERTPLPASSARPKLAAGVPALSATDMTIAFSGNRVVDGVSIHAEPGEVIGLIGGNGAGKSTLMNAIGGFVPSSGTVVLGGVDISGVPPAGRASRGLGRTFQSANLFGDLTVRETVMVALEARSATSLGLSLTGLPPHGANERAKRSEADALIDFLGLGRYAGAFISDLSTGTRRICELACLLALDAHVLCLDEPTAGVAQRETEAFGPLIKRIQAELSATMIVIEHDMPLIMSISDRVYCLEAGTLIAEGSPAEVRNNPSVIASYLGTDERAIERSNA